MSIMVALQDRLRGEFQKADGILVSVGTSPSVAATIFTSDDGGATIQALDFVTGELVWEVFCHVDTPLELVLVIARSAADGDR